MENGERENRLDFLFKKNPVKLDWWSLFPIDVLLVIQI